MAHALTVLLLAGGWRTGWCRLGVEPRGGVAAALLWYENRIVAPSDLSRVNAAFFTINGVIAVVVFIGALVDRLVT